MPRSTCHPASCQQIHHRRASADQKEKKGNSHHVRPLRRTPATAQHTGGHHVHPYSRTGSHLRAAAREAAARPRRLAAAVIAVTCAFLASAIVPAASAAELVRVPAPAAPVVAVGGMPGWQITLIAVSAALVTAIAAVFLDRMLAARRSASSTTA
jgi:hypothetical protein